MIDGRSVAVHVDVDVNRSGKTFSDACKASTRFLEIYGLVTFSGLVMLNSESSTGPRKVLNR